MSRKENYGPGFQGGPNGFWFSSLKSPRQQKKERMYREYWERIENEKTIKAEELKAKEEEKERQYKLTLTPRELNAYLIEKARQEKRALMTGSCILVAILSCIVWVVVAVMYKPPPLLTIVVAVGIVVVLFAAFNDRNL